ncbi:MAG: right-handed parallel beta-helix repeat-containing protein [Nitrospira sp. BO4]|nr:right-handed parallel beta-helix repeat-containing protein [Nitrospira sp. BO4]
MAATAAAGDILYVRAGTYTTTLQTLSMPGGGVNGTSSNRIVVSTYNGETVTVAPGGSARWAVYISTNYFTLNGFILDCTSSALGSNSACITNDNTANSNSIITNNVVKNGPGNGMLYGGMSHLFEGNEVFNNGLASDYSNSIGMYLMAIKSSTVRRNTVYSNECVGIRVGNSGTVGGGQASDNIVELNYTHTNGTAKGLSGTASCSSSSAGILIGDQRNVARYNVSYNNAGQGLRIFPLTGTTTTANNALYNNTSYANVSHGIQIFTNAQSSIVRNNHSIGNGGSQYTDSGTGTTASNNRTTGSITDCTVSTSVFTQKAGSSCIDQGSTLTGYAYNGSAPDQGAFETIVFSTCEVRAAATSTVRVTFSVNLVPPLLPATGATTFTVRKNGSSNAVRGSVDRVGDGIYDIPVTNSYAGGDTVDMSISTNNITSSDYIGNTMVQPYVGTLSNQSCTNNAGGAPAHTRNQSR